METTLCKGGSIANLGCRHCRATLAEKPKVEVDRELIPEGPWPQNKVEPGGPIGWASHEDPVRFHFLSSLARTTVSISKMVIGSREFPYKGFLVQSKSGQTLALLDSAGIQNALYIFRAGDDEWLDAIRLSKIEILKSKPPCFLGRLVHRGRWKERLHALLSAH